MGILHLPVYSSDKNTSHHEEHEANEDLIQTIKYCFSSCPSCSSWLYNDFRLSVVVEKC